ncbi:MAG: PIG-L family deacetylase [Anaerolineae bacterium]|nr:PIG-L family deacetylase [Anaerolineae bacterium]
MRVWDEADTGLSFLVAVFAHPDDESFAVGGTLAKYAAEGVRVVVVSATRGEDGLPDADAARAGAVREAELRRAAAELGVSRVVFLGYLDGGLADVDPDGAVSRLIALLRELRPQVVVTFGPDGISGHPDHVTVSRWVTAAFDELDGAGSLQKLYYVAPSLATQQGCGVADPPPLPPDAIGVDVELYLEAKVRAMQAHASQDPPYPGDPAKEAEQMACHEWFVLARPRLPLQGNKENDLFGQLVD